MNQVINNLVINADQAMKEGGVLYISAKNVFVNEDSFFPLQKGEYVIISFMDQGEGIPEQNISKIFDPYFTTKENGNGLGLATSYSIIKKHGGIIFVESTQGVGTTFFVYLPAANKQLEEKKVEKQMNLPLSGRILVMDDEYLVRKVAVKMLTRLGYEVDEVENGDDAIRVYQDSLDSGEIFDLVVMDLTIPGGMGGKEAVKRLRHINPKIKVIVSSGYSNDPIMANYKEYGFDGVVTKPYKLNELKEAILQVLFPGNHGD